MADHVVDGDAGGEGGALGDRLALDLLGVNRAQLLGNEVVAELGEGNDSCTSDGGSLDSGKCTCTGL